MDSGIGRRIYEFVYEWVRRCPDPSDPRAACPPDPLSAAPVALPAASVSAIAAGTAAGVVLTVFAASSMVAQPTMGEQ